MACCVGNDPSECLVSLSEGYDCTIGGLGGGRLQDGKGPFEVELTPTPSIRYYKRSSDDESDPESMKKNRAYPPSKFKDLKLPAVSQSVDVLQLIGDKIRNPV